jgi:hypothetical protein
MDTRYLAHYTNRPMADLSPDTQALQPNVARRAMHWLVNVVLSAVVLATFAWVVLIIRLGSEAVPARAAMAIAMTLLLVFVWQSPPWSSAKRRWPARTIYGVLAAGSLLELYLALTRHRPG